ncbi:26S proteasome non-ATPase regulatory subunit 3 [Artemisia annua]|uniref:26S proteasome non-ATPase regulatory subunit 3 n=1 Tax=Artemisia annua TaxID=35608 RepID=A0A2U1NZ82_ARTAN|nr:26S proteasome non-ATPase regulatory subunit 3 [Artemisia annua]
MPNWRSRAVQNQSREILLRNISISYSRISLADVAKKLRLDLPNPVADADSKIEAQPDFDFSGGLPFDAPKQRYNSGGF